MIDGHIFQMGGSTTNEIFLYHTVYHTTYRIHKYGWSRVLATVKASRCQVLLFVYANGIISDPSRFMVFCQTMLRLWPVMGWGGVR